MSKPCLTLVLMLSCLGAYALPSWSSLGETLPSREARKSTGYQFYEGASFAGPLDYVCEYSASDGSSLIVLSSPIIASEIRLDGKGELISSKTSYLDPGFAKILGKLSSSFLREGPKILYSYQDLKGGEGHASISADRNCLDTDSLALLLSSRLRSSPQSFNADVLLKSLGMKINVDFSYLSPGSWNPATLPDKLPKAFLDGLASYPQGFCVYRMRPTGLVGLVYKASYYFIFLDREDKPFVGYLGGSGKELEGLVLQLEGGEGK